MQSPLRELIEENDKLWITEPVLCQLLGINPDNLMRHELLSLPSKHISQRIYPAYQFDPGTSQPWPVVKTMLLQFEAAGLEDWPMVWLEKPCPSFDNQPPSAHLNSQPDQVLASATRHIIRRLANPKSHRFLVKNPSATLALPELSTATH